MYVVFFETYFEHEIHIYTLRGCGERIDSYHAQIVASPQLSLIEPYMCS